MKTKTLDFNVLMAPSRGKMRPFRWSVKRIAKVLKVVLKALWTLFFEPPIVRRQLGPQKLGELVDPIYYRGPPIF